MFSRARFALPLVLASVVLVSCAQEKKKEENVKTEQASTAQVAKADAAFVEQVTNTPNVDKVNQGLAADARALGRLASWGGITDAENQALENARAKMALVKAARDQSEVQKQVAFDAKAAYSLRAQAYQAALAAANASRLSRAKATSALTAAQKEHDDAWAAVGAARDQLNNLIVEGKGSPAQISAAEANVAKANARAEQAAVQLASKTSELDAAQKATQAVLASVNEAASIATRYGTEYAARATVATKALEALNAALQEEKTAMNQVHALNRARAKLVAETLAGAAYELTTTEAAATSALEQARAAGASKASAENRAAQAARDSEAAKGQAAKAAEALVRAKLAAEDKASAKHAADAALAQASGAYSAAKAVQDSTAKEAAKSAAELWKANKTAADAQAKAEKAQQSRNWAAKQHAEKNSPESQKTLDNLEAALIKASDDFRLAQEALPALKAKADSDAALAATAKAAAEAKLALQRRAAADSALAAKDGAQAAAALNAAAKANSQAIASAEARAQELSRAGASLESAKQAQARAEAKNAYAAAAAQRARERYQRVYSQTESYKIHPTRTPEQEDSDEQKLFAAALWAKVPEGNYWTSLVIASVRENLAGLEKARDINDWCPGYFYASEHQREVCWLRLLGGLVKFESAFKPTDKFREPSGAWSVGLMALSPKECNRYESVELLQKPLLNLACGIKKFAGFVERDGWIHGPTEKLGASSYWSTLRSAYKRAKPDGSGYYNLGKKAEIQVFTKDFKSY